MKFVDILLVNAEKQSVLHPETFETPDKKILDNLKEKDYIKVCNGLERFWCQILEETEKNMYYCVICNDILSADEYEIGDFILISKSEIYQVLKE